MKIELSEREIGVVLSALAEKKEFYKSIRENPNGITREAAEEALKVVKTTEGKLNGSGEGGCLFIYVPDGIYDEKLEKELRERIPEHPEHPDKKNVFWSKKYSNFVIRGHKDGAEEAINARYGEKATIDKDPEFATKSNTWQIVVNSSEAPDEND